MTYLKFVLTLSAASFVLLGSAISAAAHPGWGIVVDSKGHIFFTDIGNLTIWELRPDGSLEAAVTGVWTHHLFLDDQDNLYYEREEYRGAVGPYNSLWRHSPSGELTLLIFPDGSFNQFWDLFLDAEGAVYLAYHGNRRLLTVSADDVDARTQRAAVGVATVPHHRLIALQTGLCN